MKTGEGGQRDGPIPKWTTPVSEDRHRALVTAAVRGPGLELLRELAHVVIDPWLDQRPLRIYNAEQLASRVADEGADIVVVEADQCAGPLFEQPLVAVASCRGDPNNVDVEAASAAGVPVLRAPGRNADAVAELAIALLFAATRRLLPADRDVRQGEIYRDGTIPYQRFRAWELAGKTAGLVGLGAVGRALRWRLRGLGLEVLAYDPYADEPTCSLEELLDRSDIVSLHAPVNEETAGMIDANRFAHMRDGVVFLNTARAKLHDTDALVEALRSGKVGAAGLDHFEGEWLDPTHPLASMDQVVLTPHIGGATYDTESNHTATIAEDLCRLLAGARPRHLVNPEVWKGD
jgi:D-3-phosphoglycerate dehydrogenase